MTILEGNKYSRGKHSNESAYKSEKYHIIMQLNTHVPCHLMSNQDHMKLIESLILLHSGIPLRRTPLGP